MLFDHHAQRRAYLSWSAVAALKRIVVNEGFFSLYKGLTAVMAGIAPKMAVRFSSFDTYKGWLGCTDGKDKKGVFLAGLMSGVTEAVLVVTPAEVCKIRMQAQYHSMLDPEQMARRKYRNVLQTAAVIIREEGVGALYKGVVPTTLRQGCNQAVNFTFYQIFKTQWETMQNGKELIAWQHMLIGGLSGGECGHLRSAYQTTLTAVFLSVIWHLVLFLHFV